MFSEPSRPGDAVHLRAVRNDNRDDALRKIARACIAIARQQLDVDPDGVEKHPTSTPPPDSNGEPEANHA